MNIAGSNLGVARRMVRAGWAEVSVFEDPFQRLRSFQAAETTAEREGRGVHGMCEGRFHTPAH